MVYGVIIFAVAAVLVIVAYVSMTNRRREETSSEAPEDRLSDEEFRRIEFGDEDI